MIVKRLYLNMENWSVSRGSYSLGYIAENAVTLLQIATEIDSSCTYHLEQEINGESYILYLEQGDGVLTATIPNTMLTSVGNANWQIVGIWSDNSVKKSNVFNVYISNSINAENEVPASEITAFTEALADLAKNMGEVAEYAESASTSAESASTSASEARESAESASASTESASTSAERASASAESASTYATNASASASEASTHATNASESASEANASARNASTSASNASESAESASAAAESASASAESASTSAESASASAESASASAENASVSATNAGESASEASTHATNASESASEANAAARNASTSASEASASADEASEYASNASAAANEANTYAGNASASATTATEQASLASSAATSAQTYAGNASTSEQKCATYASNARASAEEAQEYVESLDNWTTVEFTLDNFMYDENSGITYLPIEAPSGYKFKEIRGFVILNKTKEDADNYVMAIEPAIERFDTSIYSGRAIYSVTQASNTKGYIAHVNFNYNHDLEYILGMSASGPFSARADTQSASYSPVSRGRSISNDTIYSSNRIVLKTNVPHANISEFYGKLQYRVVPVS